MDLSTREGCGELKVQIIQTTSKAMSVGLILNGLRLIVKVVKWVMLVGKLGQSD